MEALEGIEEWVVWLVIFGFVAVLLVLLVWAKGRGGGKYASDGYSARERQQREKIQCPTCSGEKKIERDLPPMYQNALGVSNFQRCPTCKGKGWIME